jgi:hypothetical protein
MKALRDFEEMMKLVNQFPIKKTIVKRNESEWRPG